MLQDRELGVTIECVPVDDAEDRLLRIFEFLLQEPEEKAPERVPGVV
jgi:hypothetical protein